MHLFLTSVLPFLAHNHPSAAAFLTCRHHNFHSSIIPEFLGDEERVQHFCAARQRNELEADKETQYANLYNLFVQTPLMQFSPSLVLHHEDCTESIIKPLLETKYFTRTLQRCVVSSSLTNDLLQNLSKVQSLTKVDLIECEVKNELLGVIINSFLSLEILIIQSAYRLDPTTAIELPSPPPSATKTLRSLTIRWVDYRFATQFSRHFTNLKELVLLGSQLEVGKFDLPCLSSSLPLLTHLSLENFKICAIKSLNKLVHLSTLLFTNCGMDDLSFLSQENSLPELTTLCIESCGDLSTSSLASL